MTVESRRIAVADGGAPSPHNEIVGEFPSEPQSPHAARHFLVDALRRWGHNDAVVQDAALVVTELVTNAIVHARSSVSVTVQARASVVRVAVHDRAPIAPLIGRRGALAESGRGLRLVAALASRWGVDAAPQGKIVWAELHA